MVAQSESVLEALYDRDIQTTSLRLSGVFKSVESVTIPL